MSGFLGCFLCKSKPKKAVYPVPTGGKKSRAPEMSTFCNSSSLVPTFRPQEGDFEGLSGRRPRPDRVSNRPLREYRFPRVESMIESQGNTST